MITDIIFCMFLDLDQISSTATFICDPDLDFSCSRSLNKFYSILHVGKPLRLSFFSVDVLKFCCHFCDLDFVHSNFKVIKYLRLTIGFKLVLRQFSQILLPLCNPATPSLAVSCSCEFNFRLVHHLPEITKNRCSEK